jgi:hypothetical protein
MEPVKIRLAALLPIPTDVSSLFRGAMPLALVGRLNPQIEIIQKDRWSWADLIHCDAVFLQRPCMEDHLGLAKVAKSLKLPLWVDYDDAINCLTDSNPKTIFAKQYQKVFKECLEMSDVVTVTGEFFAGYVKKYTSAEIIVIPNAFNDYMSKFSDKPVTKTVTWRGGVSHDEDLMMVLTPLAEVAKENKDWTFRFLGEPCWETKRLMPKENTVFDAGWKDDYSEYMDIMAGIAPSIHIVPLTDNTFNRCKSNLAWLEASAIGAATLAPKWSDEFNRDGVFRYSDGEFYENLQGLIEMHTGDENLLRGSVGYSREYIKKNLLLSKINQSRVDIITKLARKPKSMLTG